MLKSIVIFPALCGLTLKRLTSRPALTLLALLGIILAVGLLTSAGFFSQAVDRVILLQELAKLSKETGRIPFSTRVYLLPSARRPLGLDDAEKVGQSVVGTLTGEIGLPLAHLGMQVESGGLMLMPSEGDTRYKSSQAMINTVNLVYIANATDQLAFPAGDPLGDYPPAAPETLDVWMHANLAAEMGVHVGEQFRIAVNLRQAPRKIIIRGFWHSKDPKDRFWFNNPDTNLRTGLLVTRGGYLAFVEPMIAAKAGFVNWHIILDDQAMNPAYASRYATGFERGMVVINQYLPGAKLDVSPLDPLKLFVRRQSTLTLVLLGFNLPALGFLLYFLLLIALILARWQRRETALLVSRGMSLPTVLGLTLLEELLLFVVGVPLGIGFGMVLARGMGYTISFLRFVQRTPLPVSLQGISYTLLALALVVALLSRLLPMIGAARQSVVEQAREGARPLRPPFWQRIYLDVVLVLPTYYAYDQLLKRGTLALRASDGPDQLFQDPLLVLVPVLFILTAALLTMRLFPWLMRLLDLIASRTPWLTLHLALRQLGRNSQSYINPLLLVAVALGMGVYTRSMAASLDQWLVDQVRYRIGADITFLPAPPLQASTDSNASAPDPEKIAGFIPPQADFLRLPGVKGATRVGDYPMRLITSNGEEQGRMLAIDRTDFSTVAWFRRDFARESLGGLMNELAVAPENILVTQKFLNDHQSHLGDKVNIQVKLADAVSYRGTFTIAGLYRYFPTVQPEEMTVIANLDYLFAEAGSDFLHQIWLRMAADADGKVLLEAVRAQGIEPARVRDAKATLAIEQAKFERVGIFGTLSVGFLAASVMAVLALLVHSYASLQERLYQFGVMRAMGLLHRQVVGQVVLEYALLTLYGALIGAMIGLSTAETFAPFFRIPDQAGVPPPPLIPVVQQEASLQLALLFVLGMVLVEMIVLIRALSTRLFDALRMGHQG